MAKRFTDTDKWKKPFIRALDAPYKLLWFYILDDCDHAGIWQVDFEVAEIRTGMKVNEKKAVEVFGDRIQVFDSGKKWFLVDFISFQYGELSPKNRLHVAVDGTLTKHGLGRSKAPIRGQGQGQGEGQGDGKGKGQDPDEEILIHYAEWTQQVIDGNDALFGNMFRNEMIPAGDHIQHWVLDHRDMLSRYPKMRPQTQQAFRSSLLKHIRENHKKPINGQQHPKKQSEILDRRASFAKRHGTESGS